MNISTLSIPLNTTKEQFEKLLALQHAFALVCNTIAPVVRDTKCWNRVALHHMMYRELRDQFPQVGSQMVCNAIYSVSRTCRLIFQSEQSPFHVQHFSDKQLPLLQFLPSAPVYFDRHTVSIKPGSLSMYTLDGRMRFEVNLTQEDLDRFKTQKLHEVVLSNRDHKFKLNFSFLMAQVDDLKINWDANQQAAIELHSNSLGLDKGSVEVYLPEYVVLEQDQSDVKVLDDLKMDQTLDATIFQLYKSERNKPALNGVHNLGEVQQSASQKKQTIHFHVETVHFAQIHKEQSAHSLHLDLKAMGSKQQFATQIIPTAHQSPKELSSKGGDLANSSAKHRVRNEEVQSFDPINPMLVDGKDLTKEKNGENK